jgi:hypothetical protein
MDILDELNLPAGFSNNIEIEQAFEIPGEGRLQEKSANLRTLDTSVDFELKPLKKKVDLPIDLRQIKVKPAAHPVVKVEQTESSAESENPIRDTLFAKIKPTIDYKKIFNDFSYFFNLYPLASLNNFKLAEKLFVTYFSNRKEVRYRIAEFKKFAENFSTERDKFGKLNFDFKLKAHSLQITVQRSRLKGVKQYLSISFLDPKDFICFTQWNWKHKKEELIRSRNPLKKKMVTTDSLAFDAKVWQAFNGAGVRRKHFMKSLDCLERNQDHIIDFIKLVNKKSIINLIEPDLFSNVSIKTDNQNTVFVNFRSNLSQKVDVRMTNFASSIVVVS